jgi:uncharacterized protein (TIGR02217 family)
MAFHEVRFPAGISRGSSGGPERRTQIVAYGGGWEERNQQWANSRRRYNAGYGVRSLADIHAVIAFFEERRGRLHGFRWKDWADFKSGGPEAAVTASDQAIGTGDGATTAFQLVKTYGTSFAPWTRAVRKPVAGSVRLAVDGLELSEGVDFTVDGTTGLVSFAVAPGAGLAVTAGFEFDVPVRFDTDYLDVNLHLFGAGDIPNVPIVELRL